MSMITGTLDRPITYRVGHMCCGIGAGAKGFNDANPRVRGIAARFECAGGIDIDGPGLRNFERLTGAKGTLLDLFNREQYVAFHGVQPPAGWREATPDDIRAAYGNRPLDVLFASMPCKGFSGLLSAKASGTDKYQALNGLTLRGLWLALEAYKDRPIRVILFENVPRIRTRGRFLLNQIQALLRSYGYVFTETEHDCGEIGGLGQSRKRFLMIARQLDSVPTCVYQPTKHPLRGVGEIIGKMPLPGDAVAGGMHRVPMLQWRTWVRLAFVPAGRDWRALNDLRVEGGVLADYGIVPTEPMRDNVLGVNRWGDTAPLITGARSPQQGRFSVADPRTEQMHHDGLGVRGWDDPSRVVAGASRPHNGAHSVADPRPQQANQSYKQYGVRDWDATAGTVSGQSTPGGGAHSVADPRLGRTAFSNIYRIVRYTDPAHSVTSSREAAVADPRHAGHANYSSRKYRVTPFDEASRTVIGASTTGDGAFAVADPRPTHGPNAHTNKMRVIDPAGPASTITGSDRVGSGALSVADPRPPYTDAHKNVMRVTPFEDSAGTVTSATGPSNGAISVADPRPVCLNAETRTDYTSQGHYGVVPWDATSNAIPGHPKNNNGPWSVADPREFTPELTPKLPEPGDRLVARIIAQDNTWHRPFTTLELAALQSLFDPEEVFAVDDETGLWTMQRDFDLVGGSDANKREWIGNAVPSAAARGMAETIGEALLLADMGETFTLSTREIWVKPLAMAFAVDPRQQAHGELIG